MRLIDADALKEIIKTAGWYENEDRDTAEYLVSEAPTVSGWISVKDRLPEENGEYLISTKDHVTSAYYERGRRTSEWTDYFEGYIDFEPTHWTPLPEPPKEE